MFNVIRSARRLPALSLSSRRMYTEGSVAKSKEFGKKERAHEDQYVRQHEGAQLKKLRDEIERKKQELQSLEKEHEEIAKK